MKRLLSISLVALAFVCVFSSKAQRRVTPIDTPATATQHINENKANGDSLDRSRLVEMTDSRGNKILVDTVTGKEFIDSAAIEKAKNVKMKYPLLHSATVSLDLFTPAMRAFGTKYGLGEVAAEINLYNRYIPVLEFGLGQAENTPDDNNYTYKSTISPFFRIGMNYNFFYGSNPDYMLMIGLRYGFSPFKFEVTDISQQGGYWNEPMTYDIPSQSVSAGYFQLLFALRVRIFDNFSMGWSVRYQSIMHESATPHGKAWYIPGFGARNRSLNATFSLSYTIPLSNADGPTEKTTETINSLDNTISAEQTATEVEESTEVNINETIPETQQ